MRRWVSVAVLVSVFGAFAVGASADPPSGANPVGRILGVVPAHGQAFHGGGGGSSLVYHNGPVMRTGNTVYTIFWQPSNYSFDLPGNSNYLGLVNGFFSNVAAAHGAASNVYYSDTQYYDTTGGTIADSSTFGSGNTFTDTNPFPSSGCTDSGMAVCLTDQQIQTEVNNVIGTHSSWTRGPNSVFFMFTPLNVGSCAGSQCAFTYYCAYHSWFGSGSSVTLYANMPDAGNNLSACGSAQYPNGNSAADSTINVTSHEHNETITDEQGSAWYDRRGAENGDKCAWNFGTALGGGSGSEYNQVINGSHYYLQQEWSNHSSGCVLTGT